MLAPMRVSSRLDWKVYEVKQLLSVGCVNYVMLCVLDSLEKNHKL